MLDGFLPTPRKASLMFDVVVVSMVLVTPLLAWSIYQVRRGRHFAWHKQVQLILGTILLFAVLSFEVDIRLDASWWQRALESPYHAKGILRPFLMFIHLPIAVLTSILWLATIVGALRKFPKPVGPNQYSSRHRWLGWSAAIGMFSTAITGWIFYWMAFVAV